MVYDLKKLVKEEKKNNKNKFKQLEEKYIRLEEEFELSDNVWFSLYIDIYGRMLKLEEDLAKVQKAQLLNCISNR